MLRRLFAARARAWRSARRARRIARASTRRPRRTRRACRRRRHVPAGAGSGSRPGRLARRDAAMRLQAPRSETDDSRRSRYGSTNATDTASVTSVATATPQSPTQRARPIESSRFTATVASRATASRLWRPRATRNCASRWPGWAKRRLIIRIARIGAAVETSKSDGSQASRKLSGRNTSGSPTATTTATPRRTPEWRYRSWRSRSSAPSSSDRSGKRSVVEAIPTTYASAKSLAGIP